MDTLRKYEKSEEEEEEEEEEENYPSPQIMKATDR
jgi:hypothetical protein